MHTLTSINAGSVSHDVQIVPRMKSRSTRVQQSHTMSHYRGMHGLEWLHAGGNRLSHAPIQLASRSLLAAIVSMLAQPSLACSLTSAAQC
eukprot:2922338-Rhodomonas_salina.1